MERDKQEPIAIVGASCRFAGQASSLGSLWGMISKVRTAHGPVPGDRWDSSCWYHPDPDRKGGINVQHGYFLQEDISQFDAPFFSITAKEAAAMDPMKRMLLEVSYESMENAGIPMEDLNNSRTGCYVGCMTNDYEMISLHDIYDIGHSAGAATSEAMIANRVSWFFGLKGPSLTVDTACSSSLYALHMACQSLRLRETNLSLVAGVNLMINPNAMHQMAAMHMLSSEGISHTFDDRANGYGRGDGIGALVVKRLSDALRDGDTIRAVIRGSSVNADGKTPSVTQPSSISQAELIDRTYADAGLDQSNTTYCECHGTGTPVGDPLELASIASTLGAARRAAAKSPLYIGSIKPSIGHTEGCAGLAGVFKSILLLEKGMLVPTYGVERINPKLKLDEWHLALPEGVFEWPAGTRRASINSFGFGGANAHVILDDAFHYCQERNLAGKHNTIVANSANVRQGVPDTSTATSDRKKLFLFSGKEQAAVKRVCEGVKTWLQAESPKLDDLAYTLALRRTQLEHRTFAIAGSLAELSQSLSKDLPAATRSGRSGQNLVMVFTGQGAQWPAMGRELFSHPLVRQSMEISQCYLSSFGCTWNAIDELAKTPNPNIDRPEYSQPLCTIIQLALVDLLGFWKIVPAATVGHSSGEIAAAYAASLLTHYDAIKLAYIRGVTSAAVSKQGAMMAAGLSQEGAAKYLANVTKGVAVVACVNSPSSVTLSGDVDAIDELEKLISNDGKFARKLKVATAYHSPHMREVSPSYLEMIGRISPKKAHEDSPVMYSSLTGSMISSAEQLNAQYWVDNMQNPVKFSDALSALLKHKVAGTRTATHWGAFLEVGPHSALQGPARQIIEASKNSYAKSALYTSMLVRGKDAEETSLNAAGALWATGHKVDMAAVNQQDSAQTLCELPNYPWNHTRSFWHESYAARSYRFPAHTRSDFLGMPEDSQNSHAPRWRNYLRVSENPWLEDHTIMGTTLYPGAGMLVMALEGAARTADASRNVEGFRLTDVKFERGLVISLDDQAPVETRIDFHPHGVQADAWSFAVYSMSKSTPWVKHCTGTVALVYAQGVSEVDDKDAVWLRELEQREDLLAAECTTVDVGEFYDHLDAIGMCYGVPFRNAVSLATVPARNASYGQIAVPDTRSTMPKNYESPHIIHPATLDSIFHLLLASFDAGKPVQQAAVPYGIEEIYIAHDQPKEIGALYSGFGRVLSHTGHEITTELVVSDDAWEKPKLTIKNFTLRQVGMDDSAKASSKDQESMAKKCANITWIPDLNFVTGNDYFSKIVSGTAAESVEACFDSVFLQTSNTVLLVAMFDLSVSSVDVLRRLRGRTYGPRKIIALATSESGLQLMQDTLGSDTATTSINYHCVSENELLQTPPKANDFVLALGVPKIAKNAPQLTKLAPRACFTLASEPGEPVTVAGTRCIGHVAADGRYVLLASRTDQHGMELPDSVELLLPALPSKDLDTFASNIQSKLKGSGVLVGRTQLTLDGVASLKEKSVISLLEIDAPLVYDWDETQFQAFKTLISTVKHLFWTTRGSVLDGWSSGVEFAATQGLFRVMRNEYPVAILPTLDLSAIANIGDQNYTDLVLAVWRNSLAEDAEMEYAEQNGLIYLPRATENTGFDYELQLANETAPAILSPLGSNKQLKASLSSGGDYVWIPDKQAESPLAADEVEVKVEYAGLGAGSATQDVMHHAVGTVTRATSPQDIQIGQRVIVFCPEATRTRIRQTKGLVVPLSDGLEPQEAVALVEPLMTAQYVLFDVVHLCRSQVLLIDHAASAIGQVLIQVAQKIGAKVFALVRSRAERDLLTARLHVPASDIFDADRSNFVPLIQSVTANGVDVVISQQSGVHISRAMSIVSDFGQFVDLGRGGPQMSPPSWRNNVTLARVDMAALIHSRPDLVSKLFQRAFAESVLLRGPSPLTVKPVTELIAAVDGPSVVSLNDTNTVLMPAPLPKELELDSEATYVLAGGLGALGLDVANWMIACGAKHLVFLSRSGGSKNKKDLAKFAELSVRAEARQCNVNDATSVAEAFSDARANNRRIAGVVQLAMVLDDGIFDNMSFDQWRHAIEPKTKGSRNLLANLWPGDKPFFILLSSITGVIGNTAQANYASGNTFEDALAYHARHHLGINATSIDVGLVSDSAHFTAAGEFGDLSGYLGKYQHGWRGLQTTVAELGTVMRAIMRGATTNGQSAPAQLVLGLGDGIERNEMSADGFAGDKKFELRTIEAEPDGAGDGKAKKDVAALLSNATTMAEATAAVEDHIKDRVAASMGIPTNEVDAQKPLYDYGVDSLQAAETRNRVVKDMRSEISVFDILSAMPLEGVAAKIAANSQLVKVSVGGD